MKRREFIKGSLAVGAAVALRPKWDDQGFLKELQSVGLADGVKESKGMAEIKKYRIAFADGTKKTVEFTTVVWSDDDGSATFYNRVQGTTEEEMVLIVGNYLWMKPVG